MLGKLDRSVWVLIGANLIPLFGVLAWDWSTFEVVILYWLENVIIGAINILKIMTCSPEPGLMQSIIDKKIAAKGALSESEQAKMDQAQEMLERFGKKAGALNHGIKFFLIPFFTFHYGMFCLVHGIFVFVLLGGGKGMMGGGFGVGKFSELVSSAISAGGIWPALGLCISHLYSFFTNFLGKGEYRRTAAPILMAAPYGRIGVLHIAIIFGAFAIIALGSPVFLLVLMIVGKIALDIKLHLRSHRKLMEKSAQKTTEGSPPMV